MSDRFKNLGMVGYDSVRFVSLDLERSRDFYINKLDMALTAATTQAFEREHGYKGLVFSARNINMEIVTPIEGALSAPAQHLHSQAAGILSVDFLVQDIEFAFETLERRGATIIDEIATTERDGATYRRFEIATPLGETTYGFVAAPRRLYDVHAPGWDKVEQRGGHATRST